MEETSRTHPTPITLSFAIGLAVALVTVVAVPAAAHVAPWQTRGAYWAPAPADAAEHGFALRLETVTEDDPRWGALMAHHGSISFSPEAGTQVQDLDALSVDVYLEAGDCGKGSPRYNVRVDTDGDGERDLFVLAYPNAALGDGCPQGEWVTLDLLDPAQSTWHVPGAGRLDPGQAAAFLADEHPDHQITRVDLQWDNTPHLGPSVVWFDDLAIHTHTFSEPVGTEITCPGTVEDPVFGGFAACPFRIP